MELQAGGDKEEVHGCSGGGRVLGACWDRRRHSSGGGGLAAVSETDAGTAESGGSV